MPSAVAKDGQRLILHGAAQSDGLAYGLDTPAQLATQAKRLLSKTQMLSQLVNCLLFGGAPIALSQIDAA